MLVILALVFRMMGVAVKSLVKTKLNKKERLFCMVAYTPKATVQAVLERYRLRWGCLVEIVLTVAVISILITAPFGAICVDNSYKKLLSK